MELDLIDSQGILQLAEEHLAIGVISKYRFALIATTGEVIKSTGKLDT